MSTGRFILILLGAGVVVFFVIAVIASWLLNGAARHWLAQETGDEDAIAAEAYSQQAKRRARRRGVDAGFRGHPLTACPYHAADEPLAAEWRIGHALALLKQRHGVGRDRPRLLMEERDGSLGRSENGKEAHASNSTAYGKKDRRRDDGS